MNYNIQNKLTQTWQTTLSVKFKEGEQKMPKMGENVTWEICAPVIRGDRIQWREELGDRSKVYFGLEGETSFKRNRKNPAQPRSQHLVTHDLIPKDSVCNNAQQLPK